MNFFTKLIKRILRRFKKTSNVTVIPSADLEDAGSSFDTPNSILVATENAVLRSIEHFFYGQDTLYSAKEGIVTVFISELKPLKIIIVTKRPGLLIGKAGWLIETLIESLTQQLRSTVHIQIIEYDPFIRGSKQLQTIFNKYRYTNKEIV